MHARLGPLLVICLCALAGQAQTTTALPEAPVNAAPGKPELSVAQQSTTPPLGLRPVTALPDPLRPRVVDGRFIALTALTFALTTVDVEMTQHCLAARTCYEMNPTLPDSRAGQYAINTVTNLAVTWLSYRRKRDGKWGWWVAPAIDIGAHGVGIGTNIRFIGSR